MKPFSTGTLACAVGTVLVALVLAGAFAVAAAVACSVLIWWFDRDMLWQQCNDERAAALDVVRQQCDENKRAEMAALKKTCGDEQAATLHALRKQQARSNKQLENQRQELHFLRSQAQGLFCFENQRLLETLRRQSQAVASDQDAQVASMILALVDGDADQAAGTRGFLILPAGCEKWVGLTGDVFRCQTPLSDLQSFLVHFDHDCYSQARYYKWASKEVALSPHLYDEDEINKYVISRLFLEKAAVLDGVGKIAQDAKALCDSLADSIRQSYRRREAAVRSMNFDQAKVHDETAADKTRHLLRLWHHVPPLLKKRRAAHLNAVQLRLTPNREQHKEQWIFRWNPEARAKALVMCTF